MKITCPNCEASLNLPDDKVPVGRPFNFTCPKCKQKSTTTVSPPAGGPKPDEVQPPPAGAPERDENSAAPPPHPNPWQPDNVVPAPGRSLAGAPFAEEPQDAARIALLAVNEGPLNDTILEQLEAMDYMITASYGMRDALRQLKLSSFDLVVIGDDFDGASGDNHPLIKALQLMEMDIRRRMYVVLIGSEYRTLDGFVAYGLSVNAVINTQDVEQFEKALISGQVHQKRFYQPFLNLLDKRSLV